MRPAVGVGVVAFATLLLALARPATAGHPWNTPVLTIDAESLQQLTRLGRPVLAVDVRPPEAFHAGRLPGAQSIPLTTMTVRGRELPAGALVVLYGASSVDEAAAAFRYLRAAGRTNVVVLEGGFAAWHAGGFEVER
jgi:rhodanese-related sulfurtransferase